MKKITSLVASVSALLLITSCSHEVDFDSTGYVQQKKDGYAKNFVKKYGEINPNQTWDFTTGATLGETTRGGETSEVYVCTGLDFGLEEKVQGNTYSYNVTKNKDIYNTIKNKLKDGDTHTGQKAVLVAPGNPFVIFPLTVQGMYTHKLYVKVGNTSYLLYDKNWTIYDRPFCNGMLIGYNGWGLYRTEVRAKMKGIYVDVPAGTRIEVYLDNVNGGRKPNVGTATGNAILVDAGNAKPEGIEIHDNSTVEYIGIEDVNDGDNDFNDVVLTMVGYPNVPEEVIIKEDEYTEKTTLSKRYMVEDLGDLDDFDFNDIVIDMIENTTTTHKVTTTNGTITADDVTTTKEQKAFLRHRGGIYPFSVKIGNSYTSDEFPGVLSDDPNIELTNFGNAWNPETNNISVNVRDMNTNTVVTIPFGMQGQAPMMVAVKTTLNWMPERKAVPNSWFDPVPERLKNRPDQAEAGDQEQAEEEIPVE